MCYDVQEGYRRRIKEGIRMGRSKEDINYYIDEYNRRFPDDPIPRLHGGGYHLSGFSHPQIPVFALNNERELELRPMYWGLIPHWCKDAALATKLWNQTINARSESMFEKQSFRSAAKSKRGVVLLQSFYEHHHFSGRTYPFNISQRNGQPMFVAVLWDEWVDRTTGEVRTTFSIVTVEGNHLMTAIHNNPKLEGPRMPLILHAEDIDAWLYATDEEAKLVVLQLCIPFADEELQAHSVRPLRGKAYVGDVAEAAAPFEYPELMLDTELMEVLK
jgi:putative SOS response-associated peptidase YedK